MHKHDCNDGGSWEGVKKLSWNPYYSELCYSWSIR